MIGSQKMEKWSPLFSSAFAEIFCSPAPRFIICYQGYTIISDSPEAKPLGRSAVKLY